MLKNQIKNQIKKLHQKKYRYQFSEFIIEGIKGVEEALKDAHILVVVVEGSARDEKKMEELIKKAERAGVPIEFCGRKDIGEIKTTETFPGVLAVVEMPEYDIFDFNDKGPIIFLDGVKDPGNLGTIIRTADWFGISNILLSEDSVDPYNEKTVRSTMGSIFRTKIVRTQHSEQDIAKLKESGYKFNIFAMNGKNITTLKKMEKVIYGFGSESHGVQKNIEAQADQVYTIPGVGCAESLNLAVAVGIVMSRI